MSQVGKQAPYLDGIPVVSSTAQRDALFPAPDTHQRVQNRETGFVERYDGATWLQDGGLFNFAQLAASLRSAGKLFDITDRIYGAVGNDATINNTALANALTDARAVDGAVFIPPGIFRYDTSALTSVSGPVAILGMHRESSVLKQMTAGAHGVILDDGVRLANLTLRGTGTSTGGGINGGNTDASVVENCIIESFGGIGINLATNSTRNRIVGNIIRNNGLGAVFLGQDCNDNSVVDNECYNNAGVNCIDTNGSRNIIAINRLYGNGVGGVSPDGCGIFLWSATAGKPCQYNRVVGNIIRTSTRESIRLDGGADECSDNIIDGNTCIAPGQGGGDSNIAVVNSLGGHTRRNRIVNNLVSGGINNGIVLASTGGSLVEDNVIQNNIVTGAGIGITVSGSGLARNKVIDNVTTGNTSDYSLAGDTTCRVPDAVGSPSALASGNTNNFVPGAVTKLRLSANGAGSTLTGITDVWSERRLAIVNISANALTLANESASSNTGNRFTSPTGADVVLNQNDVVHLEYDVTTTRWRIVNITT